MARATVTAAAFALLACAGRREPAAVPSTADRQLSYSVMDLRDAALNAHDLDTAAGAYAVNAEVIDGESGLVVLRGRAAIREAHERFFRSCPGARVEVLDRAFAEQGRIVADVERIHCRNAPTVQGRARYQIERGTIVRVLQHGSPLFPAIPGQLP